MTEVRNGAPKPGAGAGGLAEAGERLVRDRRAKITAPQAKVRSYQPTASVTLTSASL